jgi:multisubunit Na+/H+ antiporter MnhB subunit
MQERTVTIPDLALIAGTRIALGAGIGLLLADKLNENQRKGAGWALLAVGVLTTIPLMINVLGKGSVPQRISE